MKGVLYDMPKKKTTEDIKKIIEHRPIHLIGIYIGYDSKTTWECNTCGNQWLATPNNIISKNSGCPVCSNVQKGKSKSIGQLYRVNSLLDTKQIMLLSPYTRIVDNHEVCCYVCKYEWNTPLNTILNNDSGCPRCAGLTKQTNEIVDLRLVNDNRNVYRIGNYINASTKISWRCEHNHKWEATPDSVLNLKSGCPICGSLGNPGKLYFEKHPHKRDTLGVLYLVEGIYQDTKFIKIGITERTTRRRFAGDIKQYQIKEIASKNLPMHEAYIIEQKILRQYIKQISILPKGFGGRTECLIYDEDIINSIKQEYF